MPKRHDSTKKRETCYSLGIFLLLHMATSYLQVDAACTVPAGTSFAKPMIGQDSVLEIHWHYKTRKGRCMRSQHPFKTFKVPEMSK